MMLKETVKHYVRQAFRLAGLEVSRTKNANIESTALRNILLTTQPQIILDVGANLGQFGDLAFREGFKGTLVSFEAVPDVHEKLARHVGRQARNWIVAPCSAIGSRSGQIEINIAGNSVSSSVLAMSQTHEDAEPNSKYLSKQCVAISTLDELAASLIPPVGAILLKVDTQGYEMEVLKGAGAILRRTVALQLELSLTPLYVGAPTFLEMVSEMKHQGYEIFSIIPGFRDKKTGRLLQVDGYFIREDSLPGDSAITT